MPCLRVVLLRLKSAQRSDAQKALQASSRSRYGRFSGLWSRIMAQVCDVCGKGPQFGNNISHAHNVTRRRWSPNLQPVHAVVKGAPKRIRACTNCIKSGKVTKA